MTYDDWKTETPEDEAWRKRSRVKQVSGSCDCCGEYRWLRQCWAPGGLETWACPTCRGEDPDAYDDEPRGRDPDDARDDWLERQAEERAHPEWNQD
jgi:hypothetical protein